VRRLPELDDRFDELWRAIASGPARLRAVRTRAVLAWRFRAELRSGRAAILAAERQGRLVGYAILLRREGWGKDLCDVADLQAVGDDPQIITDLLLGSIRIAREDGADALKLLTGTAAKRRPAEALRPHTYRVPHWQLYYRATTPELGSLLSAADAWDISLFDTF